MTTRAAFKSALKKIILNEIQRADYGVGKVSTDVELVSALNKALQSACGDKVSIHENPLNNKIVFDDGQNGAKFQVELYRKTDGECFDLTAIFHGSDRFAGKNFTKDDVIEFIKKELKDVDKSKSSVEKALAKGKAPIDPEGKKAEKNAEKAHEDAEEGDDETAETKEKTQKDIADKETLDADEDEPEIDDKVQPQLGGALVAKIEKIIDRVLKDKTKAEPKSAYLKADKDMESPDKLTVKTKETPKLKEKKS